MKKIGVLFILAILILNLSLILAETPSTTQPTAPGSGDLNQVQTNVVDPVNKVITPEGNFNASPILDDSNLNYSKRLKAINAYIGPATTFFFGVELSLSWIFVFACVLWIEFAEFFIYPLQNLLNLNFWLSLLGGFCISSIIMHGFGKNMATYLNLILDTWWLALGAILISIVIFAVLYPLIFRKINKMKKAAAEELLKRNQKDINAFAETTRNAEEELSKP